MTRAYLLAIPLSDLHHLADMALAEAAQRHGWAPHRAARLLPRWLCVEVVLCWAHDAA